MASFLRRQGGSVARSFALLPLFLVAALPRSWAQLYEQPVLVVNLGMHTAPIPTIAVDEAGRIAVTGSVDKTVRVWGLTDGKLLQTIHMPSGPGEIGKINAVAISPDSELIAAGSTYGSGDHLIYLFEARTGRMATQIRALTHPARSLAFSPDGRYLAAGLAGADALRIYDRDRAWAEAFRDNGVTIWGLAFAGDGRLATASYEGGEVRLYDSSFKLAVAPTKTVGGLHPFRIAFNPDGTKLVVGFDDVAKVDVLDGHSLERLPQPDLEGLGNGSLNRVAWSKDGNTLYAGGRYGNERGSPVVLAWANAGQGQRRALPAGLNAIGGLAALPDGGLVVATMDPMVELLESDGRPRWAHPSLAADFRGQERTLAVSTDGTVVDFGFELRGKSPLRFDLRALKLTHDPPADHQTTRPKPTGLASNVRNDGPLLTPDGKPLVLDRLEFLRSSAMHPDGRRFVVGAQWSLLAIDANGSRSWRRYPPSEVWAVNITGDGRLVLAAYGDGTIRWHRMDDGRELLALFVLADKQNWVAWTPEGFYAATPGAFGVLQWQVNRGVDAAADTVPVSAIPRLRRPDALALVLQEMEIARALGIADLKAARREVQIATGSTSAPGARLHVLTIGVSDYGDKAKDLRLKFADRDAQDVASALVNTQEGGLYAEVKPIFLHDSTADRAGIFDALAAVERNMTSSAGDDVAVVMFSGHGTMIDGQFYLVPYGVDDSTPARLKSTAIAATEFQGEISKLAAHGRVLLLLDACRSAGMIGGTAPAADLLKSALAASNVTVLTSSTADKLSREDENWQHGAFTKVLLDALGSADDIDTDHNGVISMAELTAYIAKHLSDLTGGDQQLGLDQRFQGDVFVAGL
jgi:Caspase domain